MKAVVGVDIVNDDCAARSQDRPRAVEFEAHVAFAVQTIVNEEVKLAELCKQSRKPPATGALDIRPSLPVTVTDRHPHLRAKRGIKGRDIDARKMAGSVSVQRFENKSRSHAVVNVVLDNVPGPQIESFVT
jgi:hypothetical protein